MTETQAQQDCEYCHEPFGEFGYSGGFKLDIQPLMCRHSLVSIDVYSEGEEMDDTQINYCPMCGRKFEEDDD